MVKAAFQLIIKVGGQSALVICLKHYTGVFFHWKIYCEREFFFNCIMKKPVLINRSSSAAHPSRLSCSYVVYFLPTYNDNSSL